MELTMTIGGKSFSVAINELRGDVIISSDGGIGTSYHFVDVKNSFTKEFFEGICDELIAHRATEKDMSLETVCDIISELDDAHDQLENYETEPDTDSVSELQGYCEECPRAVEKARDGITSALEKLEKIKEGLED